MSTDNFGKDPRAQTIAGWIAALEIFAKYAKDGLQTHLDTGADHDILWLQDEPKPLEVEDDAEIHLDEDGVEVQVWPPHSAEDAAMLDALAFHWDTDNESWAKFV